ncbi:MULTISPECIES: hypothetical protein [Vibrio]|uniref:hypothetical protein n=1 Tax=Vibrio TaxID=662 RepID=UPI000E6B9B4F|nr:MULTISPECIES: hypothetical protein [Vibrio]AYC06881.1 hypothetical protein FORC73_2927 [Vibrio cholerae]MCG3724032.1 hypothetical protein [Vibrio cincinnatiensis]MCG3740676.1 hypothetical protein [Vibrio cincinnatiensis]
MFKMVLSVFLGIILSAITLFISYDYYLAYKANELIEIIEIEKQREIDRKEENARKYKEALTEQNVQSCINYARKNHNNNFEMSSIEHKTELLVAISYISGGYKYHSRCFMNAENMRVRNFEIVNKTKVDI